MREAAPKALRAQAAERQVSPAFVWRERVDLIDDHYPCRCQHGAAGNRSEQDIKRFRCCDEKFNRWMADREQKVVRHIRFLVPLAFLSPRIVAAIANGDVSAGVTVSGLVRSLPFNWAEQQRRDALG
jgi:hypothetical protein